MAATSAARHAQIANRRNCPRIEASCPSRVVFRSSYECNTSRPPAGPAPSWNGEGYGPHPYHWPTRDPYGYAERLPHEPEMRLNMARWAGAARRYGSVIWNDQELPQLTEQALASTPHRKWIEQVLQQGADPMQNLLTHTSYDALVALVSELLFSLVAASTSTTVPQPGRGWTFALYVCIVG